MLDLSPLEDVFHWIGLKLEEIAPSVFLVQGGKTAENNNNLEKEIVEDEG